jgi:uncharacterized protein (TIGR00251 family)
VTAAQKRAAQERQAPNPLRIPVRLTPKGGRDAIDGWREGADGKRVLAARVAAPPEDGKANAALIRLMAKTLGVAKSQVRIVTGETSRMKILEVAGDSPSLAARLAGVGSPQ